MNRLTLTYTGELTDEDINVLASYPEDAVEFLQQRGYTLRIEANGNEVYASHYKGTLKEELYDVTDETMQQLMQHLTEENTKKELM